MNAEASTTYWVISGSSAPMSLNMLAKVGTTIQSITVTAITATQIRMIGYDSAPLTFLRVSRASRICLFNSWSTPDILPVNSPVRMISIQWCSKTLVCSAAAWWKVLPAATLAVISASTARSLRLWFCSPESFSDWSSGVPEEIRSRAGGRTTGCRPA